MRPRVFPAEDPSRGGCRRAQVRSFNEAAGIPRGRPVGVRLGRVNGNRFNEAAGIPRGRHALHMYAKCRGSKGFNEAAGIPRGRLVAMRRWVERAVASFNEAAGIPRGRPIFSPPSPPAIIHASMRPRVFPAEDKIATHSAMSRWRLQ